jgi:hypothetical protein
MFGAEISAFAFSPLCSSSSLSGLAPYPAPLVWWRANQQANQTGDFKESSDCYF